MTYHVDYILDFYRAPDGECPARDFVRELPEKPRIKVGAWLKRLRSLGPDLPRPYADILEGPIRELRVSFGRLSIRLLYFIAERSIIITHGFLKKTRRVDPGEIERARRYRELWMLMHGESKAHEA